MCTPVLSIYVIVNVSVVTTQVNHFDGGQTKRVIPVAILKFGNKKWDENNPIYTV